jgi:hemoglobin-like flavoprotein
MPYLNLDAVTASYHRCRASEGFIDTFYKHLLAKSDEVEQKFKSTDFARQKLLLRESLLAMLLLNLNSADARQELERLAERHSRRDLNIGRHLYEFWLDALCEAIEQHDPQFTRELGLHWRTAMRPGIELMVVSY